MQRPRETTTNWIEKKTSIKRRLKGKERYHETITCCFMYLAMIPFRSIDKEDDLTLVTRLRAWKIDRHICLGNVAKDIDSEYLPKDLIRSFCRGKQSGNVAKALTYLPNQLSFLRYC